MCNAIIIAPQSGQSIEVRKGQKIIVTDIEGDRLQIFLLRQKKTPMNFCLRALRLTVMKV